MKLWIVRVCSSCVGSLKTVVRLCMMIREAEDLQLWWWNCGEKNLKCAPWRSQIDCGWTFCDVSANLQVFAKRNPRISETVSEMSPKTADRPTQVESSGGRARVFETSWRWISPVHRYWRWNLDAHGWRKIFNRRRGEGGGGDVDEGVGGKLLRGRHTKLIPPFTTCIERNGDCRNIAYICTNVTRYFFFCSNKNFRNLQNVSWLHFLSRHPSCFQWFSTFSLMPAFILTTVLF